MKFSIFLIPFSVFLFGISRAETTGAHCDFYFKTQDLCASLQWLTVPVHTTTGSFRLSFWNQDQGAGTPVAPNAASIGAKLFMPGMDHGGGLVSINPTQDSHGNVIPGEFDATRVNFMMAGEWQISVQLKDQSGTTLDSAQIEYQAQ